MILSSVRGKDLVVDAYNCTPNDILNLREPVSPGLILLLPRFMMPTTKRFLRVCKFRLGNAKVYDFGNFPPSMSQTESISKEDVLHHYAAIQHN